MILPGWGGFMQSEWDEATAGPQGPTCVVLLDPDSDVAKCRAPASSVRSILDYPVCDTCYDLVSQPAVVDQVPVTILGMDGA